MGSEIREQAVVSAILLVLDYIERADIRVARQTVRDLIGMHKWLTTADTGKQRREEAGGES